MKFINLSFIALFGSSFVLAKPLDKNQCTKELCYWISSSTGGTATVVGLATGNSKAKSISIPSSVKFDKYTFTVDSVYMGAFANNKNLQEVNVSSAIKTLSISHNAFTDCSNLKRVVLSCQTVSTPNLTPFNKPSNDIVFYGRGVKSLVDDHSKMLASQWGFNTKNYANLSQITRKTDLFNLGKMMSYMIIFADNTKYDSALVSIKTSRASNAGFARLFRFLAIGMGIPKNNILVANDGNGHYWNLIKVDGKWYNADISGYAFGSARDYQDAEANRPLFQTKTAFKQYLSNKYSNANTNPSQWNVALNVYGYPDEFNGQPTVERMDSYLSQNGLGSRA